MQQTKTRSPKERNKLVAQMMEKEREKREQQEQAARLITELVVAADRDGNSQAEIASAIASTIDDCSEQEARTLVRDILDARDAQVRRLLDHNPQLTALRAWYLLFREVVYFPIAVAMVYYAAMYLSIGLGFVVGVLSESPVLEPVAAIVSMLGTQGGGMMLGLAGTAASQEHKSLGIFAGCWVGSGLYYWWLFSSM